MQGLIGRKIGMTRLFEQESGNAIPVTVIQTGVNIVHQIRTMERDGYRAVQLGYDVLPEAKVNKPLAGHFKKHNSEPTRIIREFMLDSADEKLESGQKVGVEIFQSVQFVDVTGTTKGRGFTGTVKRHNFMLGRASHGNTNYREPGSIGSNTFPGRVFPGVRMSGHYGAERNTAKRLKIIGINTEEGLIYVKGAIPGKTKGLVIVHKNSYRH